MSSLICRLSLLLILLDRWHHPTASGLPRLPGHCRIVPTPGVQGLSALTPASDWPAVLWGAGLTPSSPALASPGTEPMVVAEGLLSHAWVPGERAHCRVACGWQVLHSPLPPFCLRSSGCFSSLRTPVSAKWSSSRRRPVALSLGLRLRSTQGGRGSCAANPSQQRVLSVSSPCFTGVSFRKRPLGGGKSPSSQGQNPDTSVSGRPQA